MKVKDGRRRALVQLHFTSATSTNDYPPPSTTTPTAMGPPRRNRSGSTATASTTNSPQLHRARQQYQHPSPAPTPEPSAIGGMSAASRYDHNLKVLRRRDPSIVSIFDQFSHVCVYHHDGTRWEKQGFEGTMFLYERYVCCDLWLKGIL